MQEPQNPSILGLPTAAQYTITITDLLRCCMPKTHEVSSFLPKFLSKDAAVQGGRRCRRICRAYFHLDPTAFFHNRSVPTHCQG